MPPSMTRSLKPSLLSLIPVKLLMALMDTYWNSKTNAPSRTPQIKVTNKPGGVDLTWTRPDFKYPIRLGLRKLSDIYDVDTIFPKAEIRCALQKTGQARVPFIQMKKQR